MIQSSRHARPRMHFDPRTSAMCYIAGVAPSSSRCSGLPCMHSTLPRRWRPHARPHACAERPPPREPFVHPGCLPFARHSVEVQQTRTLKRQSCTSIQSSSTRSATTWQSGSERQAPPEAKNEEQLLPVLPLPWERALPRQFVPEEAPTPARSATARRRPASHPERRWGSRHPRL